MDNIDHRNINMQDQCANAMRHYMKEMDLYFVPIVEIRNLKQNLHEK